MRDDTRKALAKFAEMLADTTFDTVNVDAGGNNPDARILDSLYDETSYIDSARAGYQAAYTQLKKVAESSEAPIELTQALADSPSPDFYEQFLQNIENPITVVANQILASQGIHQPYFVLNMMAEVSSTAADAIDTATDRINAVVVDQGAGTDATPPSAQANEDAGEDEDLDAKGLAPRPTNEVLASGVGGYEIDGHESWLSIMPTVAKDLIPNSIIDADELNPKKSNTTFCYIKFFDPTQYYSRTEGEIAGLATALIPSIEWSRATPYLNVQVRTDVNLVTTDAGDQYFEHPMSLDNFLGGPLANDLYSSMLSYPYAPEPVEEPPTDPLVTEQEAALGVLSPTAMMLAATRDRNVLVEGQASAGMEAFTTPQAILPHPQGIDAGLGARVVAGEYASIDRMRPFMSVKDFTMAVSPAGGTSSTQRATLSLVLHDRGRLPQIANLLQPGTLNKTEFDIEWGWSHPAAGFSPTGDPRNVYGMFINSLRQRAKFTLYQTNYSFTESGQVELKLSMVTKGATYLNEIDASTSKLVTPNSAVEQALAAVKLAKAKAFTGQVPNQTETAPSEVMQPLTLTSVGSLISGDSADRIAKWISDVKNGHDANLSELASALQQLHGAVDSSVATLHQELGKKVGVLNKTSYNDWQVYTSGKLPGDTTSRYQLCYSGKVAERMDSILGSSWRTTPGKYVPLGALLQMFIVSPLFTSKLYDEVQLITYTANLNAGALAGANLGSIPIYVGNVGGGSFLDALKKQYESYGGQFAVTRFVNWFATNYVNNQVLPMYGIKGEASKNLQFDPNSGGVKITEAASKNLSSETKKALLELYYESSTPGTKEKPKPTLFRPVNLKIYFEVSSGAKIRTLEHPEGNPESIAAGNKAILRMHVVDANIDAAGRAGWLQVLSNARTSAGQGLIMVPEKRGYPGISDFAESITGFDIRHINAGQVADALAEIGILSRVVTANSIEAESHEGDIALIEQRLTELGHQEVMYSVGDTADPSQLKRVQKEKAAEQALLEEAQHEKSLVDYNAYHLSANPHKLVDLCASMAPNIVYGREGSMVRNLSIKEKSNSKAATTYMMQALRGAKSGKSEVSRGVPMRVNAADISLDSFGNPAYKFMQRFFILADTGTTIDNLYGVVGIDHSINKDDFKTTLKLAPLDAYGTFKSLADSAAEAAAAIAELREAQEAQERQAQSSTYYNNRFKTRQTVTRENSDLVEDAASISRMLNLNYEVYNVLIDELCGKNWDGATIAQKAWLRSGYSIRQSSYGWSAILDKSITDGFADTFGTQLVLAVGNNGIEAGAGTRYIDDYVYSKCASQSSYTSKAVGSILYQVATEYELLLDTAWRTTVYALEQRTQAGEFGYFANANIGRYVEQMIQGFIAQGFLPYWKREDSSWNFGGPPTRHQHDQGFQTRSGYRVRFDNAIQGTANFKMNLLNVANAGVTPIEEDIFFPDIKNLGANLKPITLRKFNYWERAEHVFGYKWGNNNQNGGYGHGKYPTALNYNLHANCNEWIVGDTAQVKQAKQALMNLAKLDGKDLSGTAFRRIGYSPDEFTSEIEDEINKVLRLFPDLLEWMEAGGDDNYRTPGDDGL